jgi:hypothetical protein
MLVRITKAFVQDWGVFNPGQEIEVTDARGVDLLQRGLAERLETVPETATVNRGERAARTARPVR